MERATLVYLLRSGSELEVLLAKKKRGIGKGKWNGYGGVVLPTDESIADAAIRELREESGVISIPENLLLSAEIRYSIDGVHVYDCSVYVLYAWQGEPKETDEMGPPRWFSVGDLPLDDMWLSDAQWLSSVLSGGKFKIEISQNESGEASNCVMRPLTQHAPLT